MSQVCVKMRSTVPCRQQFSRRYRLRVTWLGVPLSLQQMFSAFFTRRPDSPPPALHYERLKAWARMHFTAASSFSDR